MRAPGIEGGRRSGGGDLNFLMAWYLAMLGEEEALHVFYFLSFQYI
jgi:hypothetical protein